MCILEKSKENYPNAHAFAIREEEKNAKAQWISYKSANGIIQMLNSFRRIMKSVEE